MVSKRFFIFQTRNFLGRRTEVGIFWAILSNHTGPQPNTKLFVTHWFYLEFVCWMGILSNFTRCLADWWAWLPKQLWAKKEFLSQTGLTKTNIPCSGLLSTKCSHLFIPKSPKQSGPVKSWRRKNAPFKVAGLVYESTDIQWNISSPGSKEKTLEMKTIPKLTQNLL